MNCPICGDELQRVERLNPTWAPWVSVNCSRGWWDAELTPEARAGFDPARREQRTPADRDRVQTRISSERTEGQERKGRELFETDERRAHQAWKRGR